MKKLKVIGLIIATMFLLSGCTIKGEITVNYDGTVEESVSVLASTKVFESDAYSKEEMIDSILSNYQAVLNYKNYSYDYVLDDELSGARVYKTYDDICDYFGNSAFNQYVYKYMDCTETDEYYIITNATNHIAYCSDCSDWPALDDVEYKIILPFSAEQNADEQDGNTYIWRYDENSAEDKDFYLKISKASLEEAKEEYEKQLEEQKNKNLIITVCVIASILICIVIILFILYRKHKKNKLDY